MLAWPPPYTLRRSKRARRVALQINPLTGLEIVVPQRVSEREALQFLAEKRDWVQRHVHLLSVATRHVNAEQQALPSEISLPSLNKSWKIRYQQYPEAGRVILQRVADDIIFSGNMSDFRCCRAALQQWLKVLAKQHINPWLERLAHDCQFQVQQIQWREQKSRWGSCSSSGKINLNLKLLFLSPDLVRYVLIHELCHLVHMNHSESFWRLVEKFQPNYQTLRSALRDADRLIPVWYQT